MTAGWSVFVIALVVLNLVGCVCLLWWTGKRKPGDPKPTDTSHSWDGDLTEYNQPMPRWWINMFYLTIVFGVGYLIYYPGLGAFEGSAKWSSARELAKETAKATEDISRKIEAIQGDTQGTVDSIRMIGEVIAQINDISNTIASAVEEQTATANEMSRNVAEAAKGTAEIAQNITSVAQAAQSTSQGATNCQQAAVKMSRMAEELQELGAGNSVRDEADVSALRLLEELSQQARTVAAKKGPTKKMRPVSSIGSGHH